MAALTHNPSRRALLGAAVALSFSSFETGPRQAHRAPLEPDLLRMSGEDVGWKRAARAFEAAEAALRECERRTAGAPWAEQDAVEAEYGACLDLFFGALRRLLRAPAPDLGALARKIALMIDHEVATLTGGEACLAAIRRDARRLAERAGNGDSYD